MASLLFLEPYDTGSHAAWMRGYARHSAHHIEILSLPGEWWQWRMQGGAVTLARLFNASDWSPDLIVASDMLDLTTFLALTRARTAFTPTVVYFHENQLTYPPGPHIKQDLKFGFINYASALAADAVFFNSQYHQWAFLDELPRLLKHYRDYNELNTVDLIRAKSSVLPLGLELRWFDSYKPLRKGETPTILWNHRWDYDKNPVVFFNALYRLIERGIDFKVILAGENNRQRAEEFEEARQRLGTRVIQYGYVTDRADYARLLWEATIVISCAWQDFFGISMCEAIYCGCLPIMPRRLNYPDLIPNGYYDLCLYDEGHIEAAMVKHLHTHAPAALREHVARLDWSLMAGRYDTVFQSVIGRKFASV